MANIPQPLKRKFYKKWWFWLLLIIILMIGGCGGGSYYSYRKMQNSNNSKLEQEAIVEYKDLQKTVSLEGKIQSKKEANLYFGASGKVSELHVAVGDIVEEDQLLTKISDAEMASTKQKEIKAPFAGIITAVNIFENMPVSAQTVALTLASEETEIIASASENDVYLLKNNQIANITFNNISDIILGAKIISVAEQKNTLNTTQASSSTITNSGYDIKLDYNKPDNLNLKRDMSCDVEIIVDELKNVLAVPLAAIKWEDNQAYVNVKNGLNIEKKNIDIGFEGDEFVQIISGLNVNDKIILFSSNDVPKNTMF